MSWCRAATGPAEGGRGRSCRTGIATARPGGSRHRPISTPGRHAIGGNVRRVRTTSPCATAAGWRVDVYVPQGALGARPGDPDPDALLPPLRACVPAPRRAPKRRPAWPAGATCSCRAATRWWRWTCAAPARASARATASARRANATTTARSPTGSWRSPGRTGASARPASPMSAPPATSWRAPGTPPCAPSRRCRRCGTRMPIIIYPGGLLLNRLAQSYDALMVALDHDRRDLLAGFAYFKDPHLAGPAAGGRRPGWDACATRRCASIARISGCRTSSRSFRFHDDTLPYDPAFSPASFSPCHYAAGIPADVAVCSVSGWMDGAGYHERRHRALPHACLTQSAICCWGRGITARASMSRRGGPPRRPRSR